MDLNTASGTLARELDLLLGLFRELGGCLEQETKALSAIDTAAMADINSQKESIAAQIDARTEPLAKLQREVATLLGLPQESSLGKLAEKLRVRGNLEIPRLHRELNAVGERNRQLLEINREIAENFAASVGNTLELLSRLINQSNTYGASGGYQQRPAGSVLINREA